MCEMENVDSDLVSQHSEHAVDDNVLLEAACQETEELKASLREKEARCKELETVNVELKKKEDEISVRMLI